MFFLPSLFQKRLSVFYFVFILSLMAITGCKVEGLINKVNLRNQLFINTCESFQQEVDKLLASNSDLSQLQVSEMDNSEYDYYFLEPGQMELRGDSIYFRLKNDLDYPKYLEEGVAIEIRLSTQPAGASDVMASEIQSLGTLVIDRKYYVVNRNPLFMYKFPLKGKSVIGKQLMLAFAIARYAPTGQPTNYFCETDTKPLGKLEAPCCATSAWDNVHLQTAIEYPQIELVPDTFVYGTFNATMDITFKEGAFDYPDDVLALSLQSFIERFKRLSYRVDLVDLRGYASLTGKESNNKRLSQQRAEAVFQGLKRLNKDSSAMVITHEGLGEDWIRFEELASTEGVLLPAEQKEVVAILGEDISHDAKERQLKRLGFWNKVKENIVDKTRHTFVRLTLTYTGDKTSLGPYGTVLTLTSSRLNELVSKEITVQPYRPGLNTEAELEKLNEVLTQKATANLYAMRAGYQLALGKQEEVINDLVQAQKFAPDNPAFAHAIQSYQVRFTDEATKAEQEALYEAFTTLTKEHPGDRKLFFNRAILIERLGRLEEALTEYDNLFEGERPSGAQYNNRGLARLKSFMIAGATADFRTAIDKNPGLAAPYFNLAAIYAYRGFTNKAAATLSQAVDRDPNLKQLVAQNPIFSGVAADPKFNRYR